MINYKSLALLTALLGGLSVGALSAQTVGIRQQRRIGRKKKVLVKRKRIKGEKHTMKVGRVKVSSKKRAPAINWRLLLTAGGAIFALVIAWFVLGSKKNDEDGDEEEGKKMMINPLEDADCRGLNNGVTYKGYNNIDKFQGLTLGARSKEKGWFEKHIKAKDSDDEEASLKTFIENGNVVINQEFLCKLYQPDLTKLAKNKNREMQEAISNTVQNKKQYLLAKVQAFLNSYEALVVQSENRGLKNSNYISNLVFDDDFDNISYSQFKNDVTNLRKMNDQLEKLEVGIRRRGNSEEQEARALGLMFYVFEQLCIILDKASEQDKDGKIDQKKLEDALGKVEGIMNQLAGMFKHCHGRTKDVISVVLDALGKNFGLVPATAFASIYWASDSLRKEAVKLVYPMVSENASQRDDVHARNYVLASLQSFAAIPGQEIASQDEDGYIYVGNSFSKHKAARAFFNVFTPLWVMKQLLHYLLNKDKIGGVILSAEKVNAELYYLVYGTDIEKLKGAEKIRAQQMMYKMNDNLEVEGLKLDYLAYYFYRIGIFKKVEADAKCVMNVKTMTMGSLSNTGSFVPNPERKRK